MSRRKRTHAAAESRREDWLGRGVPVRGRTWAFEEQLFGASDKARSKVLDVLSADLADEKAGLARLEEALHEQARHVARLEWRLRVLQGADPAGTRTGSTRTEHATLVSGPSRSSLERDYWLCRCEGFWVDSPAGRVGLVDGLRYRSRIDQPDLLEVRCGALGRRMLLIPTDQVEQIIVAEGRLVLREAPPIRDHHLAELISRLHRRHAATA